MAKTEKKDEPMPSAILIEESIGWAANGVLRQFHEGTVVTHPDDIKALLEAGAQYREVL